MPAAAHMRITKANLFLAIACGLIFLMSPKISPTQSSRGTLTGVVSAADGAVLENASVTLMREESPQRYITKTDFAGRYSFASLEPGIYDVRVEYPSFQTQERKGIVVTVASSESVNFTLVRTERNPTRIVPAPIWNLWTEAPTSEATFRPVSPQTSRPYSIVVNLAALFLRDFDPGVFSKVSSPPFGRFLKENENQDVVDVDILLLPDPKYFLLSPVVRRSLHVDLKKVRAAQSTGIVSPMDAFKLLRDKNGDTDFNFGTQVFPVQTKANPGLAGISLSVWADGKPVDEVTFHLCLVDDTHPSCPPSNEPVSSLEGVDLSKNDRPPDSALHLIDQQTQLIGVYRCNVCQWDKNEFKVWHIEKSGEWFRDRVNEVLQQMTETPNPASGVTIASVFESAGDNLYNAVFHSNEPDAVAAANLLSQLAYKNHGQEPTPANSPTLFVRLIQTHPELVLAPIGLVRVTLPDGSRDFLGNRLLVESPLQYQDYSRQTSCLSDWMLFVPPIGSDSGLRDVEHARNAFADGINAFKAACATCVIDKEKDFEDWLRGRNPQKANAVLILSHHDPSQNKIFFYKGGSPAVQSLAIKRDFTVPSLAIIDACGTAQSGATEFVSEFNSQGVASILATSTEVEPEMAGTFLSILIELLRTNHVNPTYTVSDARFEAVRKLSMIHDKNNSPYGSRALAFVLVGNGAIRACVPPAVHAP